MTRNRMVLQGCLILMAIAHLGCNDLRNFDGKWEGFIVNEEAVRQGFVEDVKADPLVLANPNMQSLEAILTTSDGQFQETRLTAVRKTASDALATLTFDGRPLRTYVLFAPLASDPDGNHATFIISLFNDDHVELRVIRGNDLFGVFYLNRKE